mmetsp:Transcript_91456/g.230654  ORF Transcript_91456/g.230654 Transcript_91456/m.230654 type:complete len:207 (-) Transcript_91456:89-709(-)
MDSMRCFVTLSARAAACSDSVASGDNSTSGAQPAPDLIACCRSENFRTDCDACFVASRLLARTKFSNCNACHFFFISAKSNWGWNLVPASTSSEAMRSIRATLLRGTCNDNKLCSTSRRAAWCSSSIAVVHFGNSLACCSRHVRYAKATSDNWSTALPADWMASTLCLRISSLLSPTAARAASRRFRTCVSAASSSSQSKAKVMLV